jgi:hypothetical protein
MADVDWDAAINAGELPCSAGERRILQLSARLAAGTPSTIPSLHPGDPMCSFYPGPF